LADASAEMPEVLCMAYDSLLPKLSTTLWTSSSPTLIQNATTIIARALTDPNYSFPELALPMNESQGSLAHGYQQSISSANGFVGKGPMVAVLDDLGMKGLTEGGFGPARPER
jgi:neurofibromin 1